MKYEYSKYNEILMGNLADYCIVKPLRTVSENDR